MCEILSGYKKDCDEAGGVATVYAFDKNAVETLTVVGGQVTALTLKTGKFIYPFYVEMETATFTDEAVGERTAGAYARQHTGTVVLHGNSAQTIANLDQLGRGRSIWVFELNDGTYEMLFLRNGAKATDSRTPGTAYEDMNGNTITLNGKEKNKAPKISAALIAANLAPEEE